MEEFTLTVSTVIAVYAVLALGFNVQWGFGGMLNFGYIVFVALGAYMTAVLTMPEPEGDFDTYVLGLELPLPLGMLGAMAASALLALVVGLIALRRLRADYLAVFTLVGATIAVQFVGSFRPLFNGEVGLYNVPLPLGSLAEIGTLDYQYLFLGMCLLFVAATFAFTTRLRNSAFGRALRAARDDELASQAFGRDVFSLRLRAFVIGGAIAGMGGSLLVWYVSAFNPSSWQLIETLTVLTAVIVGGTANNVGVVVGAVLIVGLMQGATQLIPTSESHPHLVATLRFIFLSVVTIAILYLRPQGLVPERLDKDRPQHAHP